MLAREAYNVDNSFRNILFIDTIFLAFQNAVA